MFWDPLNPTAPEWLHAGLERAFSFKLWLFGFRFGEPDSVKRAFRALSLLS